MKNGSIWTQLLLCAAATLACTNREEVLTSDRADASDGVVASKSGLRGEYHRGVTLSDFAGVFIDPTIDFPSNGLYDVGGARTGSPVFSVRWTGEIFLRAGERTLTLAADDGARLFLDGRLLIDLWDGTRPVASTLVPVARDGWHALRIEYFHAESDAGLQLTVSNDTRHEVVASEDLRH
jgi:hypothetical protein